MAEAKENGNTLTIDGVAHDADSFSDEGKQQFVELSILEEKLKLSNQIAIQPLQRMDQMIRSVH